MNNSYLKMMKQLARFKFSKKAMLIAQERAEHEMLTNNRIVKNEVLDMADMVEDLQKAAQK